MPGLVNESGKKGFQAAIKPPTTKYIDSPKRKTSLEEILHYICSQNEIQLYMRKVFLLFLVFGLFSTAYSQVQVGLYQGGILSHIGVGTDPENPFFGEARILAGGEINPYLGLEALGHYNLKQTDWYNVHAGLMVGYSEMDEGRFGVPVGLSIKPIAEHRQFALVLEATPLYAFHFSFRALVGLRYTFRKEY